MAAIAFELPSSVVCEEVEFWRVYRDADGGRQRERVKGIGFELFVDFAAFLDKSRKQSRWIIIHRKSGKSIGECHDLERIPPYLEALEGLLNWSEVDALKRESAVFTMVKSAAKRFEIEGL